MASREIQVHGQAGVAHAAALRRRPPWPRARPRRGAPDCRSSGTGAPGSSRVRLRGSGRAARLSPSCSGTQTRPSLRRISLMSVSLDWCSPDDRDAGGMDLREAGIGEQRAALVGAPDGRGVAAIGVGGEVEDVAVAAGGQAPPRRPAWDSILPVTRSRVTMPRAAPSITIRSSISVRGSISTWPAPIWRSSAW